ncbi:MAG: hypothetical protein HZY76_20900 [Anaerolineae bacterium]|nr:MAG: hypothetical protein HZY76_20900 [Anaerolineae bacterium]
MIRLRSNVGRLLLMIVLLVAGFPSAPTTEAAIFPQSDKVIVIKPPLLYQGHRYTVEYRPAGDFNSDNSSFFFQATPEFFDQRGITALLVRRDGTPVTDEEERVKSFCSTRLLMLSTAMWRDPSAAIPPGFREDLQAVTRNPWFIEQWIKGLLKRARSKCWRR